MIIETILTTLVIDLVLLFAWIVYYYELPADGMEFQPWSRIPLKENHSRNEIITWIPVEERLPTETNNYLVQLRANDGGHTLFTFESWFRGEWDRDDSYHTIVAWSEKLRGYQPSGTNGED